jgi:hypothetical protein
MPSAPNKVHTAQKEAAVAEVNIVSVAVEVMNPTRQMTNLERLPILPAHRRQTSRQSQQSLRLQLHLSRYAGTMLVHPNYRCCQNCL